MKITVLETKEYYDWFLRQTARVQLWLIGRLDRLREGHLGDHKRFLGLLELRWKNGLRVYCLAHEGSLSNLHKESSDGDEQTLIIVLVGGNKNGQDKDIRKAKKIREKLLKGEIVTIIKIKDEEEKGH